MRPRLLSVSDAASELNASEAYVRRLLLRERLYGIKIGPVWAIFPDDLEAFKRMRRGPGRPPKALAALTGRGSASVRSNRRHAQAAPDKGLRRPRTAV